MQGVNPYAFGTGRQAPGQMGAQQAAGQMMPQQAMGQMAPQQAVGQMMPQQAMGQMMPQEMAMMLAAPRAEESYVENILRMNRGKVATVYTTNENNPQWAAKVFKGRVENAARDHVVLSDPESGQRSVIFMVNIDYITFDEPLQYQPSFYRQQ